MPPPRAGGHFNPSPKLLLGMKSQGCRPKRWKGTPAVRVLPSQPSLGQALRLREHWEQRKIALPCGGARLEPPQGVGVGSHGHSAGESFSQGEEQTLREVLSDAGGEAKFKRANHANHPEAQARVGTNTALPPHKGRARILPVTLPPEGSPRSWVTPGADSAPPASGPTRPSWCPAPCPALPEGQDWTQSLWPCAQPCPRCTLRGAWPMKQQMQLQKLLSFGVR